MCDLLRQRQGVIACNASTATTQAQRACYDLTVCTAKLDKGHPNRHRAHNIRLLHPCTLSSTGLATAAAVRQRWRQPRPYLQALPYKFLAGGPSSQPQAGRRDEKPTLPAQQACKQPAATPKSKGMHTESWATVMAAFCFDECGEGTTACSAELALKQDITSCCQDTQMILMLPVQS